MANCETYTKSMKPKAPDLVRCYTTFERVACATATPPTRGRYERKMRPSCIASMHDSDRKLTSTAPLDHAKRLPVSPSGGRLLTRRTTFHDSNSLWQYQQERAFAVETWVSTMYKEFIKDLDRMERRKKLERQRLEAEGRRHRVRVIRHSIGVLGALSATSVHLSRYTLHFEIADQ